MRRTPAWARRWAWRLAFLTLVTLSATLAANVAQSAGLTQQMLHMLHGYPWSWNG